MAETGVAVVVAETGEGPLTQAVMVGRHTLRADEPESLGGNDAGPTPHQYLLAALGACTAMTVRMYARRKGWPLEHVEVRLRHGRLPEERAEIISREITLTGALDDDQRQRLLDVAEKCPVHRTLTGDLRLVTGLGGRPAPVTGGEE